MEDLCVKLLYNVPNEAAQEVILDRSQQFLKNIAAIRQCEFRRKHKNLLHTYFSATDKFVDKKIGEAAKAGAFNWSSPELNELRRFLSKLVGID